MKLEVDRIESMSYMLMNIKHQQLDELVDWLKNGSARMKPHILPDQGSVYIFWWTGNIKKLLDKDVNKTIVFKGPNGVDVPVTYTNEWILHHGENKPIPLYIGKTSKLKDRIQMHLQLGTQRGLPMGEVALNEKRKTTSNQVRDRLERMFLYESDTRRLMIQNIGLSYVILDGHENTVNRFYLEGRMIGELFPLFNVDIER